MCDQNQLNLKSSERYFDNENFKSCFARSVAMNSQNKQSKVDDLPTKISDSEENGDSFTNSLLVKASQDSPVRYRKNNRSASMDGSRRFSCGSIVSRRASMASPPKRNEIPVENIYNQNKIETLQWQLREIEKSRGMYKAVMKQIVTFLEKAHVSLEHLGTRLNRKNSVPRSKSEHHIVSDCDNSSQTQRSLIDEHLSSWNPNKKEGCYPDEIPPAKLSQEAYLLLRTAQSLLSTQEPNLSSSEKLDASGESSDIEFLAQLAKEFPSESQKPQRTTSFSLSPKLILPENEIRISTAFNRKLSLQLSELRRHSDSFKVNHSRCDLRKSEAEIRENGGKALEKTPSSPATASISSTEDESGFSSMNSFQDVGLPLINSTGIDDVSARSVLLKSMLHNNSDYSSLSNDSEQNSSLLETTLTSSFRSGRTSFDRRYRDRKYTITDEERRHSLSDVKLWQKPTQIHECVKGSSSESSSVKSGNVSTNSVSSTSTGSQAGDKRWNSTPEQKSDSPSLKVLWV